MAKKRKLGLVATATAAVATTAMLVGATYAWFTDSVTSKNNIIQAGTLDVTMEWKDATANGAQQTYKDASEGAIFNYDKWEPGYVEAKNIQISNEGTLALKYQLSIATNGLVSELADAIDVYYAEGEYTLTDREMADLSRLGTLTEVLAQISTTANGDLIAGETDTVTLALKMQEDAGNQYQGLSIGSNFSVILMATQDNVEQDGIDQNYDDIEVPDREIAVIDGNTYHYTNQGEVVLANVPYGNVGASFTLPDDVTVLGQGDVYNDAVPVFSKYSSIETITLNEGLTEIKARAITGVQTLKSINFPSTLKAIRAQALRATGMSELELPANVEVIGDGAFRDMANLTTVTVEGNVAFDNYAFRSCPKLTSIYLLGDDVTFTGSQFATHSDNGDATGITIYVKNSTVAARLYAAQASAYGYEVKILGNADDGSDAEEIVQVKPGDLNDENTLGEKLKTNPSVVLAKGTYNTNFKIEGGSDIVIEGTGADTVLNGQIATTSSTEGKIVLRNLTINVSDEIVDSTGISQTGKSAIAIWSNQTVICENVTFNMTLDNSTAITSWWDTGIGTSIIVRNCTFNCNGNRPIRATGNVTVENCTFNDPYRYAVQLTAKASTATEMDKAIIVFNNNTIVNGKNGKAFVYGIQLEGADYGCNDCVISGEGNTIVDGGAESTMYYCECGKVQHETIEWHVEVDPVHEA